MNYKVIRYIYIDIYLKKLIPKINYFKDEVKQYPEYSIQMIGSKSTIFESFNSTTGKGINNMTNWYLCNGRYQTPNLNNNNNQLFKYIIYMSQLVKGIH